MSLQDPKYLRNHELREDICNLIELEPDRPFPKERDRSRAFTIAERRQIARAVIGDIGPDTIRDVVDRALEAELQSMTGQELNAVIDSMVGLGMENHGTPSARGKAREFRRPHLKAILEYLSEE